MVLSLIAALAMSGELDVTLQGVRWFGDDAAATRVASQRGNPFSRSIC